MADTGFKSPSNAGLVVNQWTNPTNAFSSDDTYALLNCRDNTKEEDYNNFGFSIPAGATIDGIEIAVEMNTLNVYGSPLGVRLSDDGGSVFGGDYYFSWGADLTSDTVVTLGGPTSLFGRTWIPSDFDDGVYGFVARFYNALEWGTGTHNINIDHIKIKVYYTEAETTTSTSSTTTSSSTTTTSSSTSSSTSTTMSYVDTSIKFSGKINKKIPIEGKTTY